MKVNPEIEYAQRHFQPDSWRIGGVRLLPIRLGHLLLMQAKESPFFTPSKDFKPPDLIKALWICSRPYAVAKSGKVSWRFRLRAFRLAWRYSRPKHSDEFFNRVKQFFNYLGEEYARVKRVRRIGRDGEPSAEATLIPMLMVFKRDLMSRYRSEDEFWELPLRVAIADSMGLAEQNGSVKWPSVSEEVAQ